MLAGALLYEDALRADLQRYYGIDLDDAMGGAHSAAHIAACVRYLPSDCALRTSNDEDAQWTLEAVLMAGILNSLNSLIYGLGSKKGRGKRPKLVGPSFMRGKQDKLPARAMTSEQLLEILNRPRG